MYSPTNLYSFKVKTLRRVISSLIRNHFTFHIPNISFNPLHWWPLVWGYKVEVQNDRVLHSIELDDVVKKYGGPMNVYVDGPFNLKFRKKKDVVKYCLFR